MLCACKDVTYGTTALINGAKKVETKLKAVANDWNVSLMLGVYGLNQQIFHWISTTLLQIYLPKFTKTKQTNKQAKHTNKLQQSCQRGIRCANLDVCSMESQSSWNYHKNIALWPQLHLANILLSFYFFFFF